MEKIGAGILITIAIVWIGWAIGYATRAGWMEED